MEGECDKYFEAIKPRAIKVNLCKIISISEVRYNY